MKVDWKTPEDADRLRALIAGEQNAKQRDRFRLVLLAGCGLGDQPECHRELIAAAVGRARQFVDQWVGRYRKGGIAALYPHKQPGAPCKLSIQERQELLSWLERGPEPEENLSAYNGPILREKIHARFGKLYALNGLYDLLHRLGYNDLMPRTTHPDTDPEVLESFKKKNSPRPSKRSGKPIPPSVS
jgi:transposase